MSDTRPLRLTATSVGVVAARALHAGARGAVHSVFERSAYVTLDGQLVCVGPPGLGAGPLNVLCEPWRVLAAPMNAWLAAQAPVCFERDELHVGENLIISIAQTEAWRPEPAFHVERLAQGLSALYAALPEMLPVEGFAALLVAGESERSSPLLNAAKSAKISLRSLIQEMRVGKGSEWTARPLAKLLGLGPGLTPSGDDYIGGALVALTLMKQTTVRNAVWSALAPFADRTTDISRAHLAAAAEGFGSAALHDLLGAIVAGESDAIPQRLAAVAAIGHTSGWDAVAGAMDVLDAIAHASA